LSSVIIFTLARLLEDFVRQHDLGLVRPDGLAYVLRRDPDQLRIPDVSFVEWDRIPDGDVSEGFWEGPPTLAVEVVSPFAPAEVPQTRLPAKDHCTILNGSFWMMLKVLWPRRSSVSVYLPGADTRELGPDSLLDGGDILPGFNTQISHLFDVQRRR